MSASNKILQAAAGNAAGETVFVEDVFSTYLYEGDDSYKTINNGIDLLNEGGLVWTKSRTLSNRDNYLWDTERGYSDGDTNFSGNTLSTNTTSAEQSGEHVRNIYEDGYQSWGGYHVNISGQDYVSWTFRKQAGFFDVQTFTAESDQFVTVNHDLGCNIGAVIYKETSGTGDWYFWHKSFSENDIIRLNTTAAKQTAQGFISSQTSSSARFYTDANTTSTYVAYFFGDGDDSNAQSFGDDSDESIIKCGSYTGTGSYTNPPVIDLGFEPQFVIIKNASASGDWLIGDIMRGATSQIIGSAGEAEILKANLSNAETSYSGGYIPISPTATGFTMSIDGSEGNASGKTYIYIAIRRPMKTPEAGTDVFAVDDAANGLTSGFPVDWFIRRTFSNSSNYAHTRLCGETFLTTDSTDAEQASSPSFDNNEGVFAQLNNSAIYGWMFKRATGFFDVVAYSGNSTAGRQITHNLKSVPNMIIIKNRSSNGEPWYVYHEGTDLTAPEDYHTLLNSTAARADSVEMMNDTAPTASVFTVSQYNSVNGSGKGYVAYLFATLDGVSKVGSYTGTGSDQNIDCGFSSGARFVLIRRTDSTANWNLFDSVEQGIVAGNDPHIRLNANTAQETADDLIDPYSSGFAVTGSNGNVNASGGEYIFLAIA